MKKDRRAPERREHDGARVERIIALTQEVCLERLNEEVARLCRALTEALARAHPQAFARGKAEVWACGVIYALARVNELFYRDHPPRVSAGDLCRALDVPCSTGANKARWICEAMDGLSDPAWSLPEPPPVEHEPLELLAALLGAAPAGERSSTDKPLLLIKLRQLRSRPAVWRRFVVDRCSSLAQLHRIVQIVMGRKRDPRHRFRVPGARGPALDHEARSPIGFVLKNTGDRLRYCCDGADSELVLEDVLPPDRVPRHPCCLDGRGGAGGRFDPEGPNRLLAALREPEEA